MQCGLRSFAQRVKVVRPRLHHLAARRQMLCMVVGSLHCVAFRVGELSFDDIGGPAAFMQQSGGHAAKAMRGDHRAVIAQASQSGIDGVLTHGLAVGSNAGKHPPAAASERPQLAQDADRLRPLIEQAHAWGLRVSLFMDAEPSAMAAAKAVGADRIELYTEPYAAAWATSDQAAQLARFALAAQAALDAGLGVNAGHDLNRDNLAAFVAKVPNVSEVSIGHALIADALEMGYEAAVKDYLLCITLGDHLPYVG